MSVTAQTIDSGFELKPVRRRSANGFLSAAAYTSSPVLNVSGDYFFSGASSSQINNDHTITRRASAPAMSKVYPAVTYQAPQVSVRRVALPQEHPDYNSEFPALRAESETLKRRASYPPALKSCLQRRQTESDETHRKSVQFFGFVQVQYTHSASDYDRTAIACLANGGLSESREEQLEEFRKWQHEMSLKMPEAPSNDLDAHAHAATNEAVESVDGVSVKKELKLHVKVSPVNSLVSSPMSESSCASKGRGPMKSTPLPKRSNKNRRNRSKASRAN